MEQMAPPLGSACLRRRLIRKSARSALTSIDLNNFNLRYWSVEYAEGVLFKLNQHSTSTWHTMCS
jgi:hypothetical protein